MIKANVNSVNGRITGEIEAEGKNWDVIEECASIVAHIATKMDSGELHLPGEFVVSMITNTATKLIEHKNK